MIETASKDLFNQINQQFANLKETQHNKSTNLIIEESLKKFVQENHKMFTHLQIKKFTQNEDKYFLLNEKLVEFEGCVADIFSPQIQLIGCKNSNNSYYCLFEMINEEIHNILNDMEIRDTFFADRNIYLILVRSENTDLSAKIWEQLNLHSDVKLKLQKYIPILTYSYGDSEPVKLGQKYIFKGYLKLFTNEQSPQEIENDPNHPISFRYYVNPHIYYFCEFEKQKCQETIQQSLTENNKKIVDDVQQYLSQIFKDDVVAEIFLYTLFSNHEVVIENESINHISLNIYNANQNVVAILQDIFHALGLNTVIISVNPENLKKKIFAEKNNNAELLEQNILFPGMEEVILLDETQLQVQKLDEYSTRNIMCLKEVVENNNIPIFFNSYQPFKFKFCNQKISISKTKSLFQYDISICMKDSNGCSQSLQNFLEDFTDGKVERFKQAIDYYSKKLNKIDFKSEDLETIQGFFVELRQNDKEFSQEDYKKIIKIAKHRATIRDLPNVDKQIFIESMQIYLGIQKERRNFLQKMKSQTN